MKMNMTQVGVCAIRGPDGRVVKDTPLFVPLTDEIEVATEKTYEDFARVAIRRIHEARLREARAQRKHTSARKEIEE